MAAANSGNLPLVIRARRRPLPLVIQLLNNLQMRARGAQATLFNVLDQLQDALRLRFHPIPTAYAVGYSIPPCGLSRAA